MSFVSLRWWLSALVCLLLHSSPLLSQSPILGGTEFATATNPHNDYLRGRLLLCPTALSIPAGTAYFSDAWIFFPTLTVAFLDEIALTGGMWVFPGVNLSEQPVYFAPRASFPISNDIRLGASVMTVAIEGDDIGIASAVTTIGGATTNVTAALGYAFNRDDGDDVDWADAPLLALGVYAQTTDVSAVVVETWTAPHRDFEAEDILMGAAVRFFGENLAVEVGGFFRPLPNEGRSLLLPFLNASYRFAAGR